jgi:hypothetical protein
VDSHLAGRELEDFPLNRSPLTVIEFHHGAWLYSEHRGYMMGFWSCDQDLAACFLVGSKEKTTHGRKTGNCLGLMNQS